MRLIEATKLTDQGREFIERIRKEGYMQLEPGSYFIKPEHIKMVKTLGKGIAPANKRKVQKILPRRVSSHKRPL